MFSKILIANRGEIACRVIATARRLGIVTVAVYSEADAHARHVRLADEAIAIGPPAARESYLDHARVIAAARQSGAQAIHPGYGFLSESEVFAQACEDAGIFFIGPPPAAIRAMGSKSAAKALMQAAGVPLTPGYHGDDQSPALLKREADAIGYPVLIKASAGGGGKGMRRVDRAEDFDAALASCRREAASSFGDDRVLIEKWVLRPRHIEIQVFADRHGNCVHLFERDCSVQRRHQKVLEEAPAPGMTPERRAAMGAAAVEAARAVGYVGAGTVEFIAAPDGEFFFMEMNTRLQVEHPVTEMITGLDLVEWQLRVAAGEPLPRSQAELAIHGHAIEARIYAEDPARGFLPSIGTLEWLRLPPAGPHVRVDSGVEEGDTISPWYDPMIAKLIVHDESRMRALERMHAALGQMQIVGVASNAGFLRRLVATRSFVRADLDTALIERESDALFTPPDPVPTRCLLIAALFELLCERRRARGHDSRGAPDPFDSGDGWRLNASLARTLVFVDDERERPVGVVYLEDGYELVLDAQTVDARGWLIDRGGIVADLDGERVQAQVVVQAELRHVFCDGQRYTVHHVDPLALRAEAQQDAAGLGAPMPGKVIALLANAGAKVARGAPLLVMEAMKMEHTIVAPADGVLTAHRFAVGDQVGEGTLLVDFTPDD